MGDKELSIDLQNDQVLLTLIKEGDEFAFKAVYERYFHLLYIHACKILKEPAEAEDTIQEVFSSLWLKAGQIQLTTSLSAYLYAATRNRVLNLIERKKVRTAYVLSIQEFMKEGVYLTDEQVRERELAAIIEKEIAALPEKMRIVFELSRKGELSHKEIAEMLNISEKTVKKQVQNALKILRSRLHGPHSLVILLFLH
ncbi:MAG TPA: RNA polymerase sigma-70 factor [Puia sp.]|nr:RNA polymerase sigma-70 factor [Puia sp.]